MNHRCLNTSELVWAKMKNYPSWPGKITNPPNDVKVRKGCNYIFFFGTENYGWVPVKNVYPYEKFKEQFSTKSRSSAFKKAVMDISEYFSENQSYELDESGEDIPISEDSSSEEDLSLNLLKKRINANKKINGTTKTKKIKLSKKFLYNTSNNSNIISVSINDVDAIKRLLPKELTICLQPCNI